MGGVAYQPSHSTVSEAPRRPAQFQLRHGEQIRCSWYNGALSGRAEVEDGTVAVKDVSLVSEGAHTLLEFYK